MSMVTDPSRTTSPHKLERVILLSTQYGRALLEALSDSIEVQEHMNGRMCVFTMVTAFHLAVACAP
jgi:hypothetical protein